jgi:hypothetical protein
VHIEAAIGGPLHGKTGVGEGRVAQAMAEGKKGLDILFVKPAIADVDAFTVGGFAIDALV